MKPILLLSIIHLVSGILVDLDTIKMDKNNLSPYEKAFFVVPYQDDKEDIEKVEINCETGVAAEYPTNASLVKQVNADGTLDCTWKLKAATSKTLTGKVYLLPKEFADEVVAFQLRKDANVDSYTVASDSKYIVFFSLNGGITLSSLDDSAHNFTIFSGLPEDEDSKALFVYSSKLEVDSFYIEEDHFYIQTVQPVNLRVEDQLVNITQKKFKNNGLILTPGYPERKPTDPYLNFPVLLESQSEERLITFQVSVGSTTPAGEEKEAVLATTSTSFIKIACGKYETLVYEGSSVQFNYPLPADSANFTISADTSYLVQFDVANSTTTTTTSPPTTTTVTCPPVAPNTTHSAITCPVVDCQCETTSVTSTTVSTTTQSATSSAVTAVFVLISLTLL